MPSLTLSTITPTVFTEVMQPSTALSNVQHTNLTLALLTSLLPLLLLSLLLLLLMLLLFELLLLPSLFFFGQLAPL
jgi:hypothetical protein